MKYLATLLLILGFGLSSFGQTIKSLGYNTTNGQVVANTGTNVLTFTNEILVSDSLTTPDLGADNLTVEGAIYFTEAITNVAVTRANLGLGWSALTNTNAATSLLGVTTNGQVVANTGTNVLTFTNALGATNEVTFKTVKTDALEIYPTVVQVYAPIWIGDTGTNDVFQFEVGAADQAKARTNLGLGGGIAATNTFVSYNGTNYTTNTVTISNGIITGWTQ